ncbi:MAG TPA: glycosyltransferase family 4 protein [Acidimicrobiales bacterium]|nr:glycosyltransferase family 4 protein [Acidimicrobiales bacterium]
MAATDEAGGADGGGLVLLPGPGTATVDDVVARALDVGVRRVQILAWRDLDDPEAGGSERHAHHVASLWADAGLDVTLRTSTAAGQPARAERDGYHVLRRGRRYSVFPRSVLSGLAGRGGRPDGLVEIWNGMPFFSPLWARCPRVVFLHHVHAEMWQMVLRPGRARLGDLVERRLAPPLYRRTRVVTLSQSSRDEIVAMLGLRRSRVSVVPPGIDRLFTPGGDRSPEPLVAAVGRLVPVKRFDLLIDALVAVRRRVPGLRAVIVGEGYERARLEAYRRAAGAEGWIDLPGYMDDVALLDVYRRAWVLASTSQREGWGMTISEAGACATPAVASRIAGHRDAVEDGVSGLLVDVGTPRTRPGRPGGVAAVAEALRTVLVDPLLRARLGRGARARAAGLSWEATAAGTLDALVDEAVARAVRTGRGLRRGGAPHPVG